MGVDYEEYFGTSDQEEIMRLLDEEREEAARKEAEREQALSEKANSFTVTQEELVANLNELIRGVNQLIDGTNKLIATTDRLLSSMQQNNSQQVPEDFYEEIPF